MIIKKLMLAIALTGVSILAAGESPEVRVAAKEGLSLEGARKAGELAAISARQKEANPSIAVVDESGTLLYFLRFDGGFPAGANVSVGKARTAAIFKKPTKDFEDAINKGRFTLTALPDFTPLQGGVPIVRNGQIVGAVGVSGAHTAGEDEEIAKAGAALFTAKAEIPGKVGTR